MRLALRLLALAAFVAGAAANKNHTAKGLGLGKHFTYRANVAPYAPQGVAGESSRRNRCWVGTASSSHHHPHTHTHNKIGSDRH